MSKAVAVLYSAVVDHWYVGGSWTGDPLEAEDAGAEALDASRHADGYRYFADETRTNYAVLVEDVRELGAALLAGHSMAEAYSIWCADSEVVEVPS